jgi:hypothetical protein
MASEMQYSRVIREYKNHLGEIMKKNFLKGMALAVIFVGSSLISFNVNHSGGNGIKISFASEAEAASATCTWYDAMRITVCVYQPWLWPFESTITTAYDENGNRL